MTDELELELLRRANPVPADDPRWRDRPLDARAEHRLHRLMHPAPRPRMRTRRLVLGLAASAIAVLVTFALALSGAGTVPAVAAPLPLHPQAGSRTVPLTDIARTARKSAARGGAGTRRGSHVMTWSMSLWSGRHAPPPVTVPSEHLSVWNADGSGSELVVATDPRHPGSPVISDTDGTPRTVADGKVLHRASYPPGTLPPYGLSGVEPPDTANAAALRAYLSDVYGCACVRTSDLLNALPSLLREWTPGARATAAIDELLAAAHGLRPVGAITDRLGRQGQAYVYTTDETRYMVILAPDNGRVLGIEMTVTKDEAEYRVKAGDVMSYEAWVY